MGPAFFHGTSVASGAVPVYAIVRPYNDAWKTTDVVYHTFYPYNRGKDVCLGNHSQPVCDSNRRIGIYININIKS